MSYKIISVGNKNFRRENRKLCVRSTIFENLCKINSGHQHSKNLFLVLIIAHNKTIWIFFEIFLSQPFFSFPYIGIGWYRYDNLYWCLRLSHYYKALKVITKRIDNELHVFFLLKQYVVSFYNPVYLFFCLTYKLKAKLPSCCPWWALKYWLPKFVLYRRTDCSEFSSFHLFRYSATFVSNHY